MCRSGMTRAWVSATGWMSMMASSPSSRWSTWAGRSPDTIRQDGLHSKFQIASGYVDCRGNQTLGHLLLLAHIDHRMQGVLLERVGQLASVDLRDRASCLVDQVA